MTLARHLTALVACAGVSLAAGDARAQTLAHHPEVRDGPHISMTEARLRLEYLDEALPRSAGAVRVERYLSGGGMLLLGAAGTGAVLSPGVVVNEGEVADRYMLDLVQSMTLALEGAMILGWQRDGQALGERYRAMRSPDVAAIERRVRLGEDALEHLADEAATLRRVSFVTGVAMAAVNVGLFASGEDSGGEKFFNLLGAAAGVGIALWSELHRTDAERLYQRYRRTNFREETTGVENRTLDDDDDEDDDD